MMKSKVLKKYSIYRFFYLQFWHIADSFIEIKKEKIRQCQEHTKNFACRIKGGNKMLVLVYRKCSTCQKALKWLEEHKIFFEERAIVEENPTYEELKEWYERSGMPLKKFFNTSGMLYKQMNLKEKLPQMTEDEQLKLLATNGMLVKRPLVVGEDFVLTGFREKEWEEKIRG